MDLKGKTAIVTGGGTGLGRAISLQLAAAGANLAIVYSRSEQDAAQTVADCQALGVQAIAVRADVGVEADVDAMAKQAYDAFGRIDVLVNDAGTTVFRPLSELDSFEVADWDRIMNVNVRAHWLTARAVAPRMREAGAGAIVNISSVAGLQAAGSSLPYCVSKAAAIHLAHCLAVGLAPAIRVNTVAPGLLRTRWGAAFPEEQFRHFEQTALMKRATPIEDVAAAALGLIQNDSITGQTLVVDGGMVFH